jgi:hypothetical protein
MAEIDEFESLINYSAFNNRSSGKDKDTREFRVNQRSQVDASSTKSENSYKDETSDDDFQSSKERTGSTEATKDGRDFGKKSKSAKQRKNVSAKELSERREARKLKKDIALSAPVWQEPQNWIFDLAEIPRDRRVGDSTLGKLELARQLGILQKRDLVVLKCVYTSNGIPRRTRTACGQAFVGPDGRHVTLEDGSILSGEEPTQNPGKWSIIGLIRKYDTRSLLETGKIPWKIETPSGRPRYSNNKRKRETAELDSDDPDGSGSLSIDRQLAEVNASADRRREMQQAKLASVAGQSKSKSTRGSFMLKKDILTDQAVALLRPDPSDEIRRLNLKVDELEARHQKVVEKESYSTRACGKYLSLAEDLNIEHKRCISDQLELIVGHTARVRKRVDVTEDGAEDFKQFVLNELDKVREKISRS